jgi:hemolysin activation/secretion protein
VLEGFAAIPVQERFHLGGVGTMRATKFKSLVGDRMLLANAEMRVEIFEDFQAVVFADVGDAWVAATEDLDLHTDAGIGFQDSDASFRLNLARKLDRDAEGGVFISARINRMF